MPVLTAMGPTPGATEMRSFVQDMHPGCMQEEITEAGGKVYSDCYILVALVYLRSVVVTPSVHGEFCCRWFMLRLPPPICHKFHTFVLVIVASRTFRSGGVSGLYISPYLQTAVCPFSLSYTRTRPHLTRIRRCSCLHYACGPCMARCTLTDVP